MIEDFVIGFPGKIFGNVFFRCFESDIEDAMNFKSDTTDISGKRKILHISVKIYSRRFSRYKKIPNNYEKIHSKNLFPICQIKKCIINPRKNCNFSITGNKSDLI
jgi:hypothetical protein